MPVGAFSKGWSSKKVKKTKRKKMSNATENLSVVSTTPVDAQNVQNATAAVQNAQNVDAQNVQVLTTPSNAPEKEGGGLGEPPDPVQLFENALEIRDSFNKLILDLDVVEKGFDNKQVLLEEDVEYIRVGTKENLDEFFKIWNVFKGLQNITDETWKRFDSLKKNFSSKKKRHWPRIKRLQEVINKSQMKTPAGGRSGFNTRSKTSNVVTSPDGENGLPTNRRVNFHDDDSSNSTHNDSITSMQNNSGNDQNLQEEMSVCIEKMKELTRKTSEEQTRRTKEQQEQERIHQEVERCKQDSRKNPSNRQDQRGGGNGPGPPDPDPDPNGNGGNGGPPDRNKKPDNSGRNFVTINLLERTLVAFENRLLQKMRDERGREMHSLKCEFKDSSGLLEDALSSKDYHLGQRIKKLEVQKNQLQGKQSLAGLFWVELFRRG